MVIKRK